MNCRKCGRPILQVQMGTQTFELEPEPDLVHGQVLVIGGQGAFVSGALLGQARKARLPIHTRHGVSCPEFWKQED